MERLPNHLWCTVHRELHHRDMFSTEEKSGRKSQPGVLRRCLCVPQMIAEGDIEAPYFVPYDVYGWACQHAMKVASKAADFEEWKAMRPCEPCDYWHYSDVLEDHSAPATRHTHSLRWRRCGVKRKPAISHTSPRIARFSGSNSIQGRIIECSQNCAVYFYLYYVTQ
jgi:hypothetical protein